ncbi:hypothetical protein R1sor_006529 [Riccia sorocarpa]|uniref:Uncharacterized protein n=1 Tax=Riccia sorocarpa TaxID=122646 RepID=A0ABD3HNB6_9MARC
MAHEVHDGSLLREPGYGGNAEGVIGEHRQRPGRGGKVKNTLIWNAGNTPIDGSNYPIQGRPLAEPTIY